MDKKTIIQFAWLFGLLTFITIVAIITRPTEINRLEFIEKRLENISLQKEILTDREKRNFIELGPKYDFDILNSVYDQHSSESVGDDNRILISKKRFQTFK